MSNIDDRVAALACGGGVVDGVDMAGSGCSTAENDADVRIQREVTLEEECPDVSCSAENVDLPGSQCQGTPNVSSWCLGLPHATLIVVCNVDKKNIILSILVLICT